MNILIFGISLQHAHDGLEKKLIGTLFNKIGF